jgi:hypothetical protein
MASIDDIIAAVDRASEAESKALRRYEGERLNLGGYPLIGGYSPETAMREARSETARRSMRSELLKGVPDNPIDRTMAIVDSSEPSYGEMTERQFNYFQHLQSVPSALRPFYKGFAQAGGDVISMAQRATGSDAAADETLGDSGDIEQATAALYPGDVARAFGTASRTLPGSMAAGMAGGVPGAIAYGAATAGNIAISEGRRAGLKGKELAGYAAMHAALEGAVAGMFSKVGFGGYEKMFGQPLSRGFYEGAKQAGFRTLEEIPEELITEFAQAATDKIFGVDPSGWSYEQVSELAKDTTLSTIAMMGMAESARGAASAAQRFTDDPSRKNFKDAFPGEKVPAQRKEREARARQLAQEQQREESAPAPSVVPEPEAVVVETPAPPAETVTPEVAQAPVEAPSVPVEPPQAETVPEAPPVAETPVERPREPWEMRKKEFEETRLGQVLNTESDEFLALPPEQQQRLLEDDKRRRVVNRQMEEFSRGQYAEAQRIQDESPEEAMRLTSGAVSRESAHRAAVESAIREGKITSHPDYPDLAPPKKAHPLKEAEGEPLTLKQEPAKGRKKFKPEGQPAKQAEMFVGTKDKVGQQSFPGYTESGEYVGPKKPIGVSQAVFDAAVANELDPHELQKLAKELHKEVYTRDVETAEGKLREWRAKHSGTMLKQRKRGVDSSQVKGWDEFASSVLEDHPDYARDADELWQRLIDLPNVAKGIHPDAIRNAVEEMKRPVPQGGGVSAIDDVPFAADTLYSREPSKKRSPTRSPLEKKSLEELQELAKSLGFPDPYAIDDKFQLIHSIERKQAKLASEKAARPDESEFASRSKEIIAAMENAQSAAPRGAIVSTLQLREQLPDMPKEQFDETLLEMGRRGIVGLHTHDFPANAARTEKKSFATFVKDPKKFKHALGTMEDRYYNAVSIRSEEGGTQFSRGTGGAPVADPQPGQAPSPHDIRATMARDADVPIMRGRLRGRDKDIAGEYWTHEEMVRIHGEHWGSIGHDTHEVAHHLDKTDRIVREAQQSNPSAAAELPFLDYDPQRSDPREGFAEFLRLYLTTDTSAARAPHFYAWFTNDWLAKYPKRKEAIERWKSLITDYRTANPIERLDWWKAGRRAAPLGDKLADLTNHLRGIRDGLGEQVRRGYIAKKAAGPEFADKYNARQGTARNRADHAVDGHGIWTSYDYSSKPKQLAKSLKEYLTPVAENIDLWEAYYDARASKELHGIGHNPGMLESDADAIIAQVAADPKQQKAFDNAIDGVHHWANMLVELLASPGVEYYSRARSDKIQGSRNVYMPRLRTREIGLIGRARQVVSNKTAAQGLLGARSPIRRLSNGGSYDSYMRPVEALIQRSRDVYDTAERYFLEGAFLNAAEAQGGLGKVVVEVPPENVMGRVKLEALLDSLTEERDVGGVKRHAVLHKDDATLIKQVSRLREGRAKKPTINELAKRYGLNPNSPDIVKDLTAATEAVPDMADTIRFWRQDFGAKPNEHITARIQPDGSLKLYQYPDAAVWNSMRSSQSAVEQWIAATLWANLLTAPIRGATKLVKAGAVGLSPAFGFAQFISTDFVGHLLQSKHEGFVERFYSGIVWLSKLAVNGIQTTRGKKGDPFIELIDSETGRIASASGPIGGRSPTAMRRMITARTAAQRAGALAMTPVTTISEANSIFDMSHRMGDAYAAMRDHGYVVKNGKFWNTKTNQAVDSPSQTATDAAINAYNDVTVKFRQYGPATHFLGQYIPFFGAAVVSVERTLRGTAELVPTPANMKRGRYWERAGAFVTLASLSALYWLFRHDDDDYQGQEDGIKNRYWTFTADDGTPIAHVPKPMGYLWVSALIESGLDLIVDGRNTFPGAAAIVAESMVPPMPTRMAGVGPIVDVWRDKTWYGGPIEPLATQRLSKGLRADPKNLETSKVLGAHLGRLGLSPAQTEYLLNQWTGGAYTSVVGTIEGAAQRQLPGEAVPGLRRFVVRSDYQRQIRDFYDRQRELSQSVADAKFLESPDAAQESRLRQFNRKARVLSSVFKAMRAADNPDDRRTIERHAVGLAAFALGETERDLYPNPLSKSATLPPSMEKIRTDYLRNAAEFLSEDKARNKMETKEEFEAREKAHRAEQNWVVHELVRLGYDMEEMVTEYKSLAEARKQKATPQSQGDIRRAFGRAGGG